MTLYPTPPTKMVRLLPIIMGFPITYQFLGSEHTKWRLVGNAVCCGVSRAFAEVTLNELKLKKEKNLIISTVPNIEGVVNLNSYAVKLFDNPPIKNKMFTF